MITKVWDLEDAEGLGAKGTLTLEDGTDVEVEGGTDGEVFFVLGCNVGPS